MTYSDSFIKNHKEYFKRNRSAIEVNRWNDDSSYQESVESLIDKLKKTNNREEEVEIRNEIVDEGSSNSKRKSQLFSQEKTLIDSIVNRLVSFINETEKRDERHLPKVQSFIDFTVSIIDYHLEKCEKFLDYSTNQMSEDVDVEEKLEYKSNEIIFQDTVFQNQIKIKDTLQKLNVDNAEDSSRIRLYKDDKASLILKEPLSLKIPDVKIKTDNLQVDWSVLSSKEMFINMNPDDIPRWNTKKHYWEQDKVVLQFWTEEFNKIRNGLNINGFWIHPWLYFHLNFFKTPIPQKDGTEPVINPYFRDNEWFFAETLKSAEMEDTPGMYHSAILLYGSRRISKSVLMGSVAHWKTVTKFNSKGNILGGDSGDLADLTDKVKTSLDYIEPAFKLDTIRQEWENGVTTFGIKKDNSTNIVYSSLKVTNLDGGQTRKTQKTAGGAPSVFIVDEIAKFNFLKPYLAALPSFQTPYGMKTPVILAGTSGEESLSGDALAVVSNPEAYNIMPMDWDKLEYGVDPEHLTWKRRQFATFYPGQMAYDTGIRKEEVKFSDFIKNQDPELQKIKFLKTDWGHNKHVLKKKVEDAKKDTSGRAKLLEQQAKVFYPTDPEDCFLSSEENPLPATEARQHKKRVLEEGGVGKKVRLYKKEDGLIGYDITNEPIAEYPFSGGFFDAPGVLYEEIPENTPPDFMYVAGFDDYKQQEASTDSIGSFHIYKVDIGLDKFCGKIVYSLASRPDPWSKLYRQMFFAMQAFNAKCFMENADMNFKEFLDRKRMSELWLVEAMDFKSNMPIIRGSSKKKYGWPPTTDNKKFLFGLFKTYCNQEIEIQKENGEVDIKLGVERIDDVALLDEIANYKPGNNVDRITSFMSCLGYELYLFNNYMIPTVKDMKQKREQSEKNNKNKGNFGQRLYGTKKSTKFF